MLVNSYTIPQENGDVTINAIQYIWCNSEEVMNFVNSDFRQGVSGYVNNGTVSVWDGNKFISPDTGDYIVYCPQYGSYRILTKDNFERSINSCEILNSWK